MTKTWWQQELKALRQRGLYRQMRVVESCTGRVAQVGGEEKVAFCSNNYLGLADDPRVLGAVREAVGRRGWGAGASRLVSGHTEAHERLERRLARWLGKEACLVFGSGYAANVGMLGALAGEGDLVALDQRVHASLIDGARLSGAQVRTYPHGRCEKLGRLLERGGYRRALIVTESLFSMDGDAAPLGELAELRRRYGAALVVDEAHAAGCLGPEGRGLAAAGGVLEEVDVYVGTLSKALGGVGGFVAGSEAVVELLVNRARSFIFSTASPAAGCAGAEAALEVMLAEPGRRERLAANAAYLRGRLRELGHDTGGSESHIVPVVLGAAGRTMAAAAALWERGYWVAGVRPPTVRPGTSRLRVSVTSEHRRADVEGLCRALGEVAGG